MAGSLLAPVAANAQERGERQNRHVQREDNTGGVDAGQGQERRGPRADQRQQRVQPAPDQVQVTQRGDRRGGGGGEWRGRRGDGDGSGWRGQRGGGGGGDTSGGWRGRQGGSGDAAATGTVGGWQGPRTPDTSRDAARYDRRARDNAMRYGTQDQRREAYRERRDERRDWRQGRDDRRDWRQGRADRRGSWDRGWRNDRRYSWQDWRARNRNLFRLPAYYSPYGYGYGYRRYSVGLILDQLLFGQRYWISDPFYYRLPAAPYGTQWIRYYNDVILVDVYTGEVLDVIHDFFW